jgi:tetratricopeptide (TPR) repeat protein
VEHASEENRSWHARFPCALAYLCLAAAGLRAALLSEELADNPFALIPYSDAEHYWRMAADFAAGRGLGETPFLVAPLYPVLLALLRALGAELPTLYALQTGLHIATAALVALAVRERFGPREGLAAAALFLALGEAALYPARVLSATLQLFLCALAWWEWTRIGAAHRAGPDRPGVAAVARTGLWVGLLALAFPAALLLLPLLGLWMLRRAGTARAAVAFGAGVLAIAPATLVNALASGELIPISAHSGITLAQGNDPTSVGIYTPLVGVSRSIHRQHHDVAALFERETGRAGSWSEVDGWVRARVIAWWRRDPKAAAALFASKLHWTLTSRDYDNVATFALEREQGLGRWAALAPVELPWLLGLVLVGAAVAARDRRGIVPELALLLPPLLVCIVFHYSGRYRLVAAPVLCGLAGLTLVRWRELGWPPAVTLAIALLPVPLLASDAVTGFGSLDFMRANFAHTLARQHARAGMLKEAQGDPRAAERHYRRALDARADDALAYRALYNLEIARGQWTDARDTLGALVRAAPADAEAHLAAAWLLAGVPDPALRSADAALVHAGEAARLLGPERTDVLLARALALAESGRIDEAIAATEHGETLARARGEDEVARSFASLREPLRNGRQIATPPPRLRTALH